MVNFYRTFGVNVPVGSQIKIWGNIYFLDVVILVLTGMMILMFQGWFAGCPSKIPYLVFSISTGLLAFYLMLRPHTNPGKRNFELLWFTFMKTPHFFQSINDAPTQPIHMNMRDLDSRYTKRSPMSRKYREKDRENSRFYEN